MRIAGRNPTSLFDGFGINYVIFFQGCRHHCRGCQNPSTWDMHGGFEMSIEGIECDIRRYLPLITGITLSGGDPVEQIDEALILTEHVQAMGLTVTLYTGYTFEELIRIVEPHKLIFNYIIDGRFIDTFKSRDKSFRGSENQRIWERVADTIYQPFND